MLCGLFLKMLASISNVKTKLRIQIRKNCAFIVIVQSIYWTNQLIFKLEVAFTITLWLHVISDSSELSSNRCCYQSTRPTINQRISTSLQKQPSLTHVTIITKIKNSLVNQNVDQPYPRICVRAVDENLLSSATGNV